MAHSIDKASFEALEKGWVTAAGVLIPAPWFPEVVRWAHNHPNGDLGIQLDLNAEWASYRWRPVSIQPATSGLHDPAGYLPNNAGFIGLHAKPDEVAVEFRAQVDEAKKAGMAINHLDSHGGIVLYTPWLFQEYWKASTESALPAVLSKEYVLKRGKPTQKENVYNVGGVEIDITTLPIDRIIQMEPGFAQKDWLSAYEKTLEALPPGTYLLSVHLGYNDEELQAMTVDHPNWGAQWRQNDLDVVSSPEFQKFLKDKGFILVGWKDLLKATHEHR
jgi:chitin disaccharide deacetylase